MKTLSFRQLARGDLPRLRQWLNTPHVYEWWGTHSGTGSLGGSGEHVATVAQVESKYGAAIDCGGTTQRFVILADALPIGLIQWYRLADFTAYAQAIGEPPGSAAGIDLFIGEETALSQGLGTQAIAMFVAQEIFKQPGIDRVIAGPAATNRRSIRAFEKAGFKQMRSRNVPGEAVNEAILVHTRS